MDPQPGRHPHPPCGGSRRDRGPDGRRRAAKALASSGLAAAEVDLVLVATCTAVDRSPNTAARVAARLGLPSPATMDLNVVCAGFTHALATADHAIRAARPVRHW